MKKTAVFVFFITVFGLCTFFNITALISSLLAFLLFFYLVFIKFIKKKTFLILILAYFILSPFFLGNLNYKSFSDYENELEGKVILLHKKILNDYPFFIFIKIMITHIENETRDYCCPFYKMAFKALECR